MNIDKLALQTWLNMSEAAQYLSQKIPKLRAEKNAVLRYALDGHLPLVLNLPTGTNDRQGLELEGGLWDLLTEGERGKPGRQQVEYEHNQHVPLKGITGAWVGRSGDERQLRPAGYPSSSYGAIPAGCVIGARKSALDRLAKKLAKDGATASEPESAEDRDKPLGARERETLLVIIAALAKKAEIDVSHPTTAAKKIVREVELLGAKIHWQTVDNKLKQVKEVVEKLKT